MKTKTETNRSPLGFPSGSFPERPARPRNGILALGSDNLFPYALAAMSRLSTTTPPDYQRQSRLHFRQGIRLRPGKSGSDRTRRAGQRLRRVAAAGIQQSGFRQGAVRQRLSGSGRPTRRAPSSRCSIRMPRAAASQGTTGMRSCTTTGRPTTPDGPGSYRSTRCSSPPKTARCAA